MIDISAVLTCHREGLLVGPSIASFRDAISQARSEGITVEALIVIDRGDALTKSVLGTVSSDDFTMIETDCGDPGQTRNAAVAAATGDYVSFLDGDDLWSFNWLSKALSAALNETRSAIWHSEVNVVFGGAQQMWWHVDSDSPSFDREYMKIGNYWDAMCFAERTMLQRFPFRPNNLADGFGHEDWHWNCVTLGSGIPHRPVPETVHFKRRRKGSQMAKCDEQDVTTHDSDLMRFDWRLSHHV